jgi:hypothetical protein
VLSCPEGIRVASGSRVALRGADAVRVAVRCADGGRGCVQGAGSPPR